MIKYLIDCFVSKLKHWATDAGLVKDDSSHQTAIFQCFKHFGYHFWRTPQGGKLTSPLCVPKQCGNCPKGET
jgi:hypothetical protein